MALGGGGEGSVAVCGERLACPPWLEEALSELGGGGELGAGVEGVAGSGGGDAGSEGAADAGIDAEGEGDADDDTDGGGGGALT